jgi:hypothetical protein
MSVSVTVYAEGVDYSRGGFPGSQALHAAGKSFAGRYAVSDLSPDGRGITANEYRELTSGNINTYLYWEAEESWMLGGWQRGVDAARNALANIERASMPLAMPVYYSHDIDPTPDQFPAIDDCLNGAASVVGRDRVGFYGGWAGIDHVHAVGTARWLCQTIAWQYGRGVHPASHLHQYNTGNNVINGVDCDLVAAVQPHYGQASDFAHPATTTTRPPYPPQRIPAPDHISAQGHTLLVNADVRFRCTRDGLFRTAPSIDAPSATPSGYASGKMYTFDYRAVVVHVRWLVSKRGSWAPAADFAQE